MRYAKTHKDETRGRLLEYAARLLRAEGVAGASVARVMAGLGMTVGGFYRHFASQEVLAGEAAAHALRTSRDWLFAGLEGLRGEAFLAGLVGRYLSTAHRDAVERGCPLPATVTELARLQRPARRALIAEVEATIARVAERLQGDPARARARAIGVLAACVGGVALSRALGGALGQEVLHASAALARGGP